MFQRAILFLKEENDIKNKKLFYISIILAIEGFIYNLLWYTNHIKNNYLEYYLWPISIILFVASLKASQKKENKNYKKIVYLVILTLLYFASHLFHYQSAPWNNYGLFDDAAWDIYLSKQECFTNHTFETIFHDQEVANISRELLFHYYITILFKIFGYNMLTFNMGLVFLGYITVLFTALLAMLLFQSSFKGFLTGVLINFFPIHFTQVFMGHRYAICLPLVMISAYYIAKSIQNKSLKLSAIGGVFAGLAMQSAVMGKQNVWALLGSLIMIVIFYLFKKDKARIVHYVPYVMVIAIGYFVTCVPLYSYIMTHKGLYRIREASITKEFFDDLSANGWDCIANRLKILFGTLFDGTSINNRQFSAGFPVLKWYHAVALFLGILIAFYRKWFWIILITALPVVGCVVATSYDYRLLIGAPAVCILMLLAMSTLQDFLIKKLRVKEIIAQGVLVVMVGAFLIQPCAYLYRVIQDVDSEYLLRHTDLMVSRYIQDVVVGEKEPNFLLKKNEFNRVSQNDSYDVFAATLTSYAHIHAFLEPYDSRKILSIFGDFPYAGSSEEDLKRCVYHTFQKYQITNKDLVIVLEYDNKIKGIIDQFVNTGLVEYSEYSDKVDGYLVKMVTLKIKNKDLRQFRKSVILTFDETYNT